MSLFKCDKCGCLENTALTTGFWGKYPEKPVLCSECASGKWHGRFKKRQPTKEDELIDKYFN